MLSFLVACVAVGVVNATVEDYGECNWLYDFFFMGNYEAFGACSYYFYADEGYDYQLSWDYQCEIQDEVEFTLYDTDICKEYEYSYQAEIPLYYGGTCESKNSNCKSITIEFLGFLQEECDGDAFMGQAIHYPVDVCFDGISIECESREDEESESDSMIIVKYYEEYETCETEYYSFEFLDGYDYCRYDSAYGYYWFYRGMCNPAILAQPSAPLLIGIALAAFFSF